MMSHSTMTITTIVEINIKAMFNQSTMPFVKSVNTVVTFIKGIMDKILEDFTSIIKAIMPGKTEMKLSGVSAL